MSKENIKLKRISINIPTNVVDKVKEYADNLGVNVTSAYIILLNQALEQKDLSYKMSQILKLIEEAKQSGILDDDINNN